jgi:PAS domain S-box-containing protein
LLVLDNAMNIATAPSRLELVSQLQRLVGVHTWTLDLRNMVMRIEVGRDFNDFTTRELPMSGLNSILSPDEMRLVASHWQEAAHNGFAGPTLLPFVRADMTKSQVESACCRMHSGGENYLIGIFRRPSVTNGGKNDSLMRKERLLIEYIEAFIENSPSAIVVADPTGNIVSINQECLRFLGKTERKEVIRQPLVNVMRTADVGLGDIVAQVLPSSKPMRGRYEAVLSRTKRHTLYWRVFPLSLSDATVPPKVFAFDLNSGGPQVA